MEQRTQLRIPLASNEVSIIEFRQKPEIISKDGEDFCLIVRFPFTRDMISDPVIRSLNIVGIPDALNEFAFSSQFTKDGKYNPSVIKETVRITSLDGSVPLIEGTLLDVSKFGNLFIREKELISHVKWPQNNLVLKRLPAPEIFYAGDDQENLVVHFHNSSSIPRESISLDKEMIVTFHLSGIFSALSSFNMKLHKDVPSSENQETRSPIEEAYFYVSEVKQMFTVKNQTSSDISHISSITLTDNTVIQQQQDSYYSSSSRDLGEIEYAQPSSSASLVYTTTRTAKYSSPTEKVFRPPYAPTCATFYASPKSPFSITAGNSTTFSEHAAVPFESIVLFTMCAADDIKAYPVNTAHKINVIAWSPVENLNSALKTPGLVLASIESSSNTSSPSFCQNPFMSSFFSDRSFDTTPLGNLSKIKLVDSKVVAKQFSLIQKKISQDATTTVVSFDTISHVETPIVLAIPEWDTNVHSLSDKLIHEIKIINNETFAFILVPTSSLTFDITFKIQ